MALNWDVPKSEKGLETVLKQIEECRTQGDEREVANGLLALAYLVKWVRSHTNLPPFQRSAELAMEALQIFQKIGDRRGEARALRAAAPFQPWDLAQKMLATAYRIFEEEGDTTQLAWVLFAQSNQAALGGEAVCGKELKDQALELFHGSGALDGQAACLFSKACDFTSTPPAEGRALALEAARLYRQVGAYDDAAKAVSVALTHEEEGSEIHDREEIIHQGLADAQQAGDRAMEGSFYKRLAQVAAAKGQAAEAEKYIRWSRELQDADGLTPKERRKEEIESTKTMIKMAKSMGHKEAVESFQQSLKDLKRQPLK
jgi:hypothetical protein